jgi:hypothetical protein
MNISHRLVTLHPYFKAHAGRADDIQKHLRAFVEKTSSETACLFYEFTQNEDVTFCREGYTGGEGVLAHLENVGALLGEMLTMADLIRLEVHGPADELDKLRGPLANLPAAFFVRQCGLEK